MGRGNVCTFGEYEGLLYVDNNHINFYTRTGDASDEPERRLLGELSSEDLSSGEWVFDEAETDFNWQAIKANFKYEMTKRFPSFTPCQGWVGADRDLLAILENNLFYIAVCDNEWSMAFMLIQKEHWCFDYSGLQKKHYQRYLDAIRDSLFEQFEELGTYSGAWTHGTIRRDQVA